MGLAISYKLVKGPSPLSVLVKGPSPLSVIDDWLLAVGWTHDDEGWIAPVGWRKAIVELFGGNEGDHWSRAMATRITIARFELLEEKEDEKKK